MDMFASSWPSQAAAITTTVVPKKEKASTPISYHPHNRSLRHQMSSMERPTTTASLNAIDTILKKEKQKNDAEPWNKLDKGTKIRLLQAFTSKYVAEHSMPPTVVDTLNQFFMNALENGKLQKTKDLVYDKKKREIVSIPALRLNTMTNQFTLRNMDPKRVCTLKSLTPLRTTTPNNHNSIHQNDQSVK